MKLKIIFLVLVLVFCLNAVYAAEAIPKGPWNYVNGVWVKVELPDKDSAWEWVPGHWNTEGKWVTGHWKKIDTVPGNHWVAGHWNSQGKWVPGHWSADKKKVWVPAHRGPRGRLISGHWEYR